MGSIVMAKLGTDQNTLNIIVIQHFRRFAEQHWWKCHSYDGHSLCCDIILQLCRSICLPRTVVQGTNKLTEINIAEVKV